MSQAANQVIPEGYKQAEVGVIPVDWEVSKIGSVVSLTTGCRNTQDKLPEGQYPFFVRSQTVERINTYSFDGEAVLTAGDGVGTGKIFHYINGKFDYHQRVYLMHNFGEKIDGYFFYIYFSNFFYDRIMSMTAKSSVDSVRREMIADMLIALPPKEEQIAIANALSDMDALLGELEKLIAKKQAIKTATMQQLLTGKTRLPQFAFYSDINSTEDAVEGKPNNTTATIVNIGACDVDSLASQERRGMDSRRKSTKTSELGEIPEDWEVVEFGTLTEPAKNRINPQVIGGGHWCVELEHVEQGKGSLNGSAVTTNFSSIKTVFNEQDVLFGKLRSYLRKYWLAEQEGVCSTEIWVFRPKNGLVISSFLYQLVQTDSFIIATSEAYGTHMPRADWSAVKNYKVVLPSLEEQTAIATILSDMDNEIQTLEQRLSKTRQIKQGMMQDLLTGRTRLPISKEAV